MLKLEGLKFFIAVVETGSFSLAADKLQTPQSTLSRRIQQLEEDLGARLLERSARKVKLTAFGEGFLLHANKILHEVDDATFYAECARKEASGVVEMAAIPLIDTLLCEEFLAGFLARFPLIQLKLRRVSIHSWKQPLEADILLNIHPHRDSNNVTRRITDEEQNFFASPKLLERFGIPGHPRQLRHFPCVQLDVGHLPSGVWEYPENGKLQELQVSGPAIVIDSPVNALKLATQGVGVAWLPASIAKDAVRNHQLMPLFGRKYGIKRSYYAIFSSRTHLPARVRVVIDALAHFFGSHY